MIMYTQDQIYQMPDPCEVARSAFTGAPPTEKKTKRVHWGPPDTNTAPTTTTSTATKEDEVVNEVFFYKVSQTGGFICACKELPDMAKYLTKHEMKEEMKAHSNWKWTFVKVLSPGDIEFYPFNLHYQL